MELKIMTPDGLKFKRTVEKVTLPAEKGIMQVLPGHASSVVLLTRGEVLCDHLMFGIGGGVARISSEEVLVFVEAVRGLPV